MSAARPAPPLLLHVFPTFAVGGAQIRSCAIANRFGTTWRHAIVAIDGDTACRERLRRDLVVDYLAVRSQKGDPLGNVLRYRRVLRQLRPDVLVTHNWGAIEWAMANRLAGLRHVHIEDGFGPEERERQLPRRVWTRRLLLRATTVVLPSRTLWRIAGEVWRLNPRRLRYIPNGIDLGRFAAGARAARLPPVIGTVAALRPEKNLARLLRTFAIVRRSHPARLEIAGDGPERAALQALAGSLGVADSVRFHGHLPAPQLAYRGFDIFALSSDTEQMPLALLEAMAAGLPVAATDVGDVAAMLAEANRRFVTAREDAALAGALAALLGDPALCHALGRANRARAEAEYDQERMFSDYADVLIGPHRPRPSRSAS
jgi:glycosyltransferase involved in cell wall biosynthesis